LEGLEKSFRIKHLYLQHNKIKNLGNIFSTLKFV
jgi:hypothetical protein